MTGILSKPIHLPNKLAVALVLSGKSPEGKEKGYELVGEYVQTQIDERLKALRLHYGFSPLPYDGWEWDVLLHLAEDFVLGFRSASEGLSSEPGRRKGSTVDNPLELFTAVTDLTAKGHTLSSACEALVRADSSKWHGLEGKVLKARFDRHNKKLQAAIADDDPNSLFHQLNLLE